MDRRLAFLTAFLGFTAVALGALGAHAIKGAVLGLPDAVDRLNWWELGARYHLIHALAVGLVAVLSAHVTSRFPNIAAGLFTLGIILFSGSLYVMALTGVRTLFPDVSLGEDIAYVQRCGTRRLPGLGDRAAGFPSVPGVGGESHLDDR